MTTPQGGGTTPHYARVVASLRAVPRKWLVTGAAGFIGSHLVESLLGLGQWVVGLDNFSTGSRENLDSVRDSIPSSAWDRFEFLEGDIRDLHDCRRAMSWPPEGGSRRGPRGSVDLVLHQAAVGSVPRSIADPILTHASNSSGFLNMLVAAKDAGVRRVVYAVSSSTYGDSPALPKVEEIIGAPLSPYAVTKYTNELYAKVFGRAYGMETVGLRYFNVFGPRQDPEGAYAAVIPKWIASLIKGDAIFINGDGETSRDFCYVANVIQANLLAALADGQEVVNDVFNIAVGERTSLSELFTHLRSGLSLRYPHCQGVEPVLRDFREGDVRHSLASIEKARRALGYCPTHRVPEGLALTIDWFAERLNATAPSHSGGL